MAMRFTGLLSRAAVTDVAVAALKPGHLVRPFEDDEPGLVIRMPGWQPAREMLAPYLADLGIAQADWMFIAYETWAGPVDYFQRYGQVGDQAIGSVSQYDFKARKLYPEAMEIFGLSHMTDDFAPLRRGYWGTPG